MAKWKMGANELAAPRVIKLFVWIVVLGVVGYSEVLYLGIVGVLFPAGMLYAACMLGAFATGISVLCLYAGKTHWFRPGTQLIAAWFFTGVEVIILVLNDVLAMAIHNGAIDQYLSLYRFFVPAVPVIALVGWGIMLYLDPERRVKHARMEMEDQQKQQMLDFEYAQFEAQMEVRYQALEYMKEHLKAAVASDVSMAMIKDGAFRATNDALTQLTGIHLPVNQLTAPDIVNSVPSAPAAPLPQQQPPITQNTEPLPVADKPSKK